MHDLISNVRFTLHGWFLVAAVYVLPEGTPKYMLSRYVSSYFIKLNEYEERLAEVTFQPCAVCQEMRHLRNGVCDDCAPENME